MANFTILIIALTISALVCGDLLSGSSVNYERSQYRAKTKIIHDRLIAENCKVATSDVFEIHDRSKRNAPGASIEDVIHMEAERALYNKLVSELVECRKAKTTSRKTESTSSPSSPSTTLKTVAPSTAATKKTVMTPSPSTATTTTTSTSTQAPTTTPQTTTTTRGPPHKFTGLKIAASSVPYLNFPPQNIIDGQTPNDTDGSFCNSNPAETHPYIIVDLGKIRTVVNIVMWSRIKGHEYQVSDMEYRVAPTIAGLDDQSALCYRRPGKPTVRPERFNCTIPIAGRYVKAAQFKATGNYFCFNELEIFGY